MPPPRNINDWDEYKKLVLAKLEELQGEVEYQRGKISALESENKVLQFKSGLWGAVAGAIPAVVALVYFIVKN